jgi:hypothetical protein
MFILYSEKASDEMIEPRFLSSQEIKEEKEDKEFLEGLTQQSQPHYRLKAV